MKMHYNHYKLFIQETNGFMYLLYCFHGLQAIPMIAFHAWVLLYILIFFTIYTCKDNCIKLMYYHVEIFDIWSPARHFQPTPDTKTYPSVLLCPLHYLQIT